jgi:GxxExxY protein
MEVDEDQLNRITQLIIGLAFKIHNVLGPGFAERVYENALVHELRKAGLLVEQQVPVKVWYDGIVVGEYVADLIVEGCVLVENKAIKTVEGVFAAQCINYLACTGKQICLLLNFGAKVEVKRFRGRNVPNA